MRRVHCCPCSILRGNPPLVLLAVLLSLAMTLFAPLQHVDAKQSSDPPIHDVGGTEGPDDSPSIAYHAFLEKFKTRIDHSPTVLSHKEVFEAVRWRLSAPVCVRTPAQRGVEAHCAVACGLCVAHSWTSI